MASTENQGCLSVLFPFLRSNSKPDSKPETLPYRLRDDFLSPAELSFYKVLSAIVGKHFVILTKVRLADIFFVTRPNENFAYFNKIAQRHVDYLLCDPNRMKPLVGIELDDTSHQKKNRQQRDKFVEQVFQTANLPLLRFPAQRAYNTKEISAQIASVLKDKTTSASSSDERQMTSKTSSNSVPICPKCGVPMVLRTVKQGKYKGKQFYGCVNYPRCREVKPIPKSRNA